MASAAQLDKIKELTQPPFKMPLASLLKSVTDNKAASLEELTSAQAKDVIAVFKKFKK
jgi:hypothetical protein